MKHLYFLSGLGADERIFQFLQLPGYVRHYIRWIRPYPQETLEHYADRLTAQIEHDRPILIGVSFGGMIAVEMAKLMPVEKLILISSAKTREELPPYFQLLRGFPLHSYIPIQVTQQLSLITADWWFSVASQPERDLLRSVLQDTDPAFLQWAIDGVLHWDNATPPKEVVHIHGTGDRLLPIAYVKPDITIADSGHLMIVSRAAELSTLLTAILA